MFSSITNLMRGVKERPGFPALVIATALVVLLLLAFNPSWQTNDDAAMSMIAHGYGLAAYGSPQIVFSNVLWGYLVRAIPSIDGVLGYSIATLSVLIMVGWTMLYFLLRLGTGYLTGILAVALLMLQPALFPQFTVNAGLLTAAAVIGWRVYARFGGGGTLLVACTLAFLGYLIRDKEFLLVLGVALPFLPWQALRQQRQMQIAFLILGILIASASAFDRWTYSGADWRRYTELSAPLTDLVDFGAGWHLAQRPEIIGRYGYSENDIGLVTDWFFVDERIADPKSLNAMLSELGPLPVQEDSLQKGYTAVEALSNPMLLPLILTAILLLALAPGWSVAISWAICLAALFATGIMGRPSPPWVHVPLLSLLLIAPLVVGRYKDSARRWMVALALFIGCVWSVYTLMPQALEHKMFTEQVQRDIQGLPGGVPIFVWAQGFPYEYAFPVLANDAHSRSIKFYGLNAFTTAPFSVAYAEQEANRGMLVRLQTKAGIPVIASQARFDLLRTYCKENLRGYLREAAKYRTPTLTIKQVRCENASSNSH